MNALSVRSTTSAGQSNANTISDATLFADPSQYDGVQHSGGPDATQCTIWDMGSTQNIDDVGYYYHGAMGGCRCDFSTDGVTYTGSVGPFGVPASGPATSLISLPPGSYRGVGRYVRFIGVSPAAGRATDETVVTVGGTAVGGPADTTAPVPASAVVNSAGNALTVNWAEATPPVLEPSGHGTNQGITLTATEGAVTVSSVSTTGTTTTATLSRTIHSSETVTLAIGAGSFTDSATAHNANAAVSGFAVTNGSTVADPAPPNAPTGMTATAGYVPTQVVWSWVAPASGPTPDSYNLYTGTFPGSETLRQSGITGLSFADTAVVLRVPNSGYVRAVAGGIEGPPSLRAILTVVTPPAGCSMCPPMF